MNAKLRAVALLFALFGSLGVLEAQRVGSSQTRGYFRELVRVGYATKPVPNPCRRTERIRIASLPMDFERFKLIMILSDTANERLTVEGSELLLLRSQPGGCREESDENTGALEGGGREFRK